MAESHDVAIIGAGFGGIGMAIALKQRGKHSLVILEKEGEVGGAWRDNTYPGAACDVPSRLYSFSFAKKFDWSRRFAPQAEIFAYLRQCADDYGLHPHLRFNTEVEQARFDEAAGLWHIRTPHGEIHARVLITATGQLNRPAWPSIPGRERFQGPAFHSARWDHDVDLVGKTVAVVGTGASAIQFVPEVAKQAKKVRLFQRSAAYVIPKPDRVYSSAEQKLMERMPLLQKLDRGRIYAQNEARVLGFTAVQSAMGFYQRLFKRYLKRCISDPQLREKLTPDYPLGCKRILISNDYFQAIERYGIEVHTGGVGAITETGVVDAKGQHHEADVLIYGTGFQATDFLAPMTILGREGRDLNDAWRDGAEAYLGINVHGFPNMFMLYGPNTNLGHNSIVYMLESQIAYVMSALEVLEQGGHRFMDVDADVQDRFNSDLQEQIRHTVWDKDCHSWYKTESGKNTNNWPGFTFTYRRRTQTLDTRDYELSS
ncbi:NAD(P)/FAD-dependent oxidoreductase [Salinisphaera sp.]|uniref:flavin-containing monooxygenase n=1 Tax=Salinisphaera sp. TaxID=1914330 RepID=UPI000C44138D|nr:NAD(P)/FAD-dependent oxidoreductase [Salinisphaera sp.]MBS62097.1 4-hydroxyacetophenone monooxygenase [Salinisphaera sp.]